MENVHKENDCGEKGRRGRETSMFGRERRQDELLCKGEVQGYSGSEIPVHLYSLIIILYLSWLPKRIEILYKL